MLIAALPMTFWHWMPPLALGDCLQSGSRGHGLPPETAVGA